MYTIHTRGVTLDEENFTALSSKRYIYIYISLDSTETKGEFEASMPKLYSGLTHHATGGLEVWTSNLQTIFLGSGIQCIKPLLLGAIEFSSKGRPLV